MKLVLNNGKEFECKTINVELTTGSELRVHISLDPESVDFVDVVTQLGAGEFAKFKAIRNDGSEEEFTNFTVIFKASKRVNDFSNDIFIELGHENFVNLNSTTNNDTDGDGEPNE